MEGNSAPPHYNPNDSLLKGGDTVPITPVQGGGGITDSVPPPSYNPNESMFNGGDSVPIVAVRGGAKNNASSTTALSNNENVKNNEEEDNTNNTSTAGLNNNNTNSNVSTVSSFNNNNSNDNDASVTALNNNNNLSNASNNASNNNNTSITPLSNENDDDFSEISSVSSSPETNEKENKQDEPDVKKEVQAQGEPCEAPTNEKDKKELEGLEDHFVSSANSIDTDSKTVTIQVKAIRYKLRLPERDTSVKPDQYKDPVYDDWQNLKFTDQETEFLNSLELSPKLLFQTFHCLKKSWQFELAEFLYFLTVENCWPGHITVTHAKCQWVREFLALVGSQMCVEKLRKAQKEKAKPSTPSDVFLPPIDTSVNENEGNEGEDNNNIKNENNSENNTEPSDENENADENNESLVDNTNEGTNEENTEDANDNSSAVNNNDNTEAEPNTDADDTNSVKSDTTDKTTGKKKKAPKKSTNANANENEETDDEIYEKIIQQIELTKKGDLGKQILLENIVQRLPEQYQTKDFMNKLVQKAIIDPKDPWYKKLSKKFFGKGGTRQFKRRPQKHYTKKLRRR